MLKLYARTLVASAIALTSATGAAAEPITIIGGTLAYSRQDQAGFNLTLTQGWMRGQFGDNTSESWNPDHMCLPCTPGSTINPSQNESMGHAAPAQPIGVGGGITWRGVAYDLVGLQFSIDADDLRIPNLASTDRTGLAQFVLRGLATGRTPDGVGGIGLGLLGYGKAQVFFDDGRWFATEYRFEDPAAVPEPATMLLLATGAGLMARRRSEIRRG